MYFQPIVVSIPVLLVFLTSCSEPANPEQKEIKQLQTPSELSEQELNYTPVELQTAAEDKFEDVEWDDLIPSDILEALLTPPEYINNIVDGSLEDNFEQQINEVFEPSDDPYQQALTSTKVIPEMDGKRIKIPGFIVPIETNEDNLVTEFFIVPYFGACLHMPPPPPNQIIYATYPQGVEQPTLFDPFWLSGELNTQLTTNDIAQAAYEMRVVNYELYTE